MPARRLRYLEIARLQTARTCGRATTWPAAIAVWAAILLEERPEEALESYQKANAIFGGTERGQPVEHQLP